MFDGVAAVIGSEPGALTTPVAEYGPSEGGLRLTAGYAYAGPAREGFEIVELPAVASAMCGVHLGPMETIARSWQAIHEEIVARGFVPSGPCRELYVRAESDDQRDWVTELQQPVARAD